MNALTTPVALVALELGIDADALAARLSADVILDAAGIRVVASDTARRVVSEHRAALQARRDQDAAEVAAARSAVNPMRERIQALRSAQAAIEAPSGPTAPGEALAIIQMLDGSQDEKLDASAARFDELTTGTMPYHRIGERR